MSHFDIEKLEKELKELESKTMEPNFWNDAQTSNQILGKIKKIKRKYENYKKIETEIKNLIELTQLIKIEPDEEIEKDIIKNLKIH